MRVAVIGGGIVGVSLGYFLSRAGHSVVLYEASDQIGGLAGTIRLGDVEIDRFYHTILSSDTHMQELAAELGIADRLRFRATGSAFFHEGRLYPMTTLRDFMAFPLLRAIDRARLGLTILAAYFHRDWHRLEEISVEEWLTRWGGRRAFHHLWRPMLRAKFDGRFEDLPATYIWARLIRTRSTRSGVSQREMAGYLVGGHMTLIRAMAQAIEAAGGRDPTPLPGPGSCGLKPPCGGSPGRWDHGAMRGRRDHPAPPAGPAPAPRDRGAGGGGPSLLAISGRGVRPPGPGSAANGLLDHLHHR